MTPHDLAAELFELRRLIWEAEWLRADLARALVESCDDQTLRQVCADTVGTSQRNVTRWARKARRFPPSGRDPIYSPRYHKAHEQQESS